VSILLLCVSTLQYIIWEVDEDLEGTVKWGEFQKTFQRNNAMADNSNEPRGLYNIILFLVLDETMKCEIFEDETRSVLFARYGPGRTEVIMAKLFGDQLKMEGGPGTLTFKEYLGRVGVRIQPSVKYSKPL